MDEPLIYTTLGNVPISSLEYRHFWIDNERETTLVEEYRHQGELVKRAVHVRLKQSAELFGEAAALG